MAGPMILGNIYLCSSYVRLLPKYQLNEYNKHPMFLIIMSLGVHTEETDLDKHLEESDEEW